MKWLNRMLGMEKIPEINDSLQKITRRAERLSPLMQAETYVSIGGIESTLLSTDNRIIFGRRGTGKTHVIGYVSDKVKNQGDYSLILDMRTIGSNSYI